MDFAGSDWSAENGAGSPSDPVPTARQSAKIVIAGGFGSGKTTLVGSISEIEPLTTEAVMTEASETHDDLSMVPNKLTTTVAMDFGRITLDEDLVLYLFGTPGQHRFWFMWDDLVRGAIGAVVLVDTRRLADCFPAIDFFEDRKLPFVIAMNRFEGAADYPLDEIREALALPDHIPLVACDARARESTRDVLVCVVEHALRQLTAKAPA